MSSFNPIGIPFIELPSVDSTNNYAMGLVREGMAQHGTAVFTKNQTKGKGQRNRHWNSEAGQNIAISLVFEPLESNPPALFLLSMAVALGTRQLLGRYIDESLSIKWPNDIYWRDRKAAGILIENLWQGSECRFVIAGIGININQTEFGLLGNNAVSLKQISGREHDPLLLAKQLCTDVNDKYRALLSRSSEISAAYKAHLYKKNETVRLKKGNRVFNALIRDVSPLGQLVVEHGVEERFNVGEVEWLRP